jgi:hypothetical protein
VFALYTVKRGNRIPCQFTKENIEHLSTEVEQNNKDRVEWYRGKVQDLSSQGYSQSVLI